jgi:hypothetical protein
LVIHKELSVGENKAEENLCRRDVCQEKFSTKLVETGERDSAMLSKAMCYTIHYPSSSYTFNITNSHTSIHPGQLYPS